MRVQVRARSIDVRPRPDQPLHGLRLAVECGENERVLLLRFARGRCQQPGFVPPPQADGRGERQLGPARSQMLGGSDVAVDEGVVRAAVRRGPGVEKHVDELDLDATLLCDA